MPFVSLKVPCRCKTHKLWTNMFLKRGEFYRSNGANDVNNRSKKCAACARTVSCQKLKRRVQLFSSSELFVFISIYVPVPLPPTMIDDQSVIVTINQNNELFGAVITGKTAATHVAKVFFQSPTLRYYKQTDIWTSNGVQVNDSLLPTVCCIIRFQRPTTIVYYPLTGR